MQPTRPIDSETPSDKASSTRSTARRRLRRPASLIAEVAPSGSALESLESPQSDSVAGWLNSWAEPTYEARKSSRPTVSKPTSGGASVVRSSNGASVIITPAKDCSIHSGTFSPSSQSLGPLSPQSEHHLRESIADTLVSHTGVQSIDSPTSGVAKPPTESEVSSIGFHTVALRDARLVSVSQNDTHAAAAAVARGWFQSRVSMSQSIGDDVLIIE